MSNRRLLNLPPISQSELCLQYPWIRSVHEDERPADVKVLSIATFDHWLSFEEACEYFEQVSPEERALRKARQAKFCDLLVAGTKVLSFAFRGRARDRLVFRGFTSQDALAKYCAPGGGRTLGHRHFYVALPELDCVFYESWDNTNHFFFTNPNAINPIYEWAQQSGLHVLSHA